MKLLSGAIWVLWCTTILVVVMLSLSLVKDNTEVRKQPQVDAFTSVTFDLINGGLSGYSEFLMKLRNALEAPSRTCGLPTTRGTPPKGQEYVYVELKISNTEWVTLGIDVMNLYVVGYKDNFKYNKGKSIRSTFFKDTTKDAKDRLFPDATITRTSKFSSTYGSLESHAKEQRVNLRLKLKLLEDAITAVYGKQNPNDKEEAHFVLVAIQIVSEAARFKFIENAIVHMDTSSKIFRNKMVAFQNNWSKISEAVHKAEAAKPKCTTFTPPLKVNDVEYHRVDQIENEMGILKFKKNKQSLSDVYVDDDGVVDNDQNLLLDEL